MKKYLMTLGLLAFLSGCFGGKTPPAQFYTLMPDVPTIVSETADFTLGIDRVQIPQSLERPQMMTVDVASPDVHLSEMNRWIEPLNSLIQRTLILDLEKALPNVEVKQRVFTRDAFTYTLSVDIIQLEATLGDKVSLFAWTTIQNAKGEVVARTKIQESVNIGTSYADMARGQSTLIGRMATQTAEQLLKLSAASH